jgi:AraC-like DNA-binding protein
MGEDQNMLESEIPGTLSLLGAGIRGLANYASSQGQRPVEQVAGDMGALFQGLQAEFERLRRENEVLRRGAEEETDEGSRPAGLEIRGLRIHQDWTREAQGGDGQGRNDIEVGFVESGSLSWLFNGRALQLQQGTLYAFWAIRPHQVARVAPGTMVHGLSIPLHSFVAAMLPTGLSKALLSGQFVQETASDEAFADGKAFRAWGRELSSSDPDRRRAVLREVEARLYRLASHLRPSGSPLDTEPTVEVPVKWSQLEKFARIAEYISLNFKDPISVPDIARAVGLRPSAATKLFKRCSGINLVQYLIQQRISWARRLLTCSGLKVPEIVEASGFRSVSRFYAVHKKIYGMSPMEFRARELGRTRNRE